MTNEKSKNNSNNTNNDKSKPTARILIVDDNKNNVDTIRKGLEENGMETVGFTSSREALEEFTAHSSDYCVLLADIRMPGITGFDLIKEAERINPKVKRVLMSSFAMHSRELSDVLPDNKVDGFVKKPVNIPELTNTILNLVGATKSLKDS